MKATPDKPKRPADVGKPTTTQRVWALRLVGYGKAVCVLCLKAKMPRILRSVSGATDHLTTYHKIEVPTLPVGAKLAHLVNAVSVEVEA